MENENRDRCPDHNRGAVRALRQSLLYFALFVLVLAAMIVLSAGRFGWAQGWIFLAVYVLLGLGAVAYLWRTNPEVIVARSSIRWSGQTAGQNVIVVLLIGLFMVIFPIAGLDAGRFHWSHVPLWIALAGYVLFLIGMAGTIWVMRVNKFAEPSARIQTERGHKVIDTGPYAIVRHPLYAATFFLCLGIPLALGSYWAFLPSGLAYLVLIVRTGMEDRMLQKELAGYKEYALRVRYRLMPGIW